mmetsp:Transcript_73000/g.159628  ORF Transcript_73000/g.159628 Transcript_73000/m.159628 type:complete len:91 (-) Transcript_73000:489-761(-)
MADIPNRHDPQDSDWMVAPRYKVTKSSGDRTSGSSGNMRQVRSDQAHSPQSWPFQYFPSSQWAQPETSGTIPGVQVPGLPPGHLAAEVHL